MTTTADSLESLREYGKERGYDLRWLERRDVWGQQVDASEKKGGLLLQDVDGGVAGGGSRREPEHDRPHPRLMPRSGVPRVGNYPVRTKADIWLRNGAELYEEAVARQWSSATDIPWHDASSRCPTTSSAPSASSRPSSPRSSSWPGDVPGKWIASITPDYYEPRMYPDLAGDGRGAPPGRLPQAGARERRRADAAQRHGARRGRRQHRLGAGLHRDVGAAAHQRRGLVLTLFRMGELMALQRRRRSSIYRLCAQDESRHVAFGVMHLQYLGSIDTDRREEIQSLPGRGGAGAGHRRLRPESGRPRPAPATRRWRSCWEAARTRSTRAYKMLLAVRQRQVKEYIQRVRVAGFGERFENGRANPTLKPTSTRTRAGPTRARPSPNPGGSVRSTADDAGRGSERDMDRPSPERRRRP